MGVVTCSVCGREIDSRGLSGHMKSHSKGEGKNNGVISYPSNEQKDESQVSQDNTPGKDTIPNTKPVKKPVKKPVTSKVTSKLTSKPDPRGERNAGSKNTGHPKKSGATVAEHEYQGLFR